LNDKSNIVSLGEGGTFLHRCGRLGQSIGIGKLFVKDETTNPTGSFMDRGTTVVVSKAKEFGCQSVRCRTKGNLGASLAAYSAKAGLRCRISVPGRIDLGKFYQMVAYGVQIEVTRGEREHDKIAPFSRSKDADGYLVTTDDPFLLEGEKTTGYEMCEQMDWSLPDRIVVPMGSGSHLFMIWKGIKELDTIGIVDSRIVKMTGVQVEGCAPIVEALRRGSDKIMPAKTVRTVAVDLAVKNPKHGDLVLQALRESKGTGVAVSDREIVEAMKLLAKAEGIFAEPAAASTIAGIKRLIDSGEIDRSEKVVCVVTGMGLKDPRTARRLVQRTQESETTARRIEGFDALDRVGRTKMRIMQMLGERELHGYGVWKALQHVRIKLDVSTVYQHLVELEMNDLVRKTKAQRIGGKPERLCYRLTSKGESILRSP